MNNPLTAEIVDGFDSLLVRELIGLQQTAFPPQMQFQEPERYYQEALCNSRNVNVVTAICRAILCWRIMATR
jgi:hypothetical protein